MSKETDGYLLTDKLVLLINGYMTDVIVVRAVSTDVTGSHWAGHTGNRAVSMMSTFLCTWGLGTEMWGIVLKGHALMQGSRWMELWYMRRRMGCVSTLMRLQKVIDRALGCREA
jgi:hypothetical protein